MPIYHQVWLEHILEHLTPEHSFLTESENLSNLVKYNMIHMAEAGIEPEVLIDNTVFPIPCETRTDVPIEIPLHTLDTKNTIVRSVDELQTSYDKRASIVKGHARSLIRKKSSMAAYNWCPKKDSDYTPVLKTTGAAHAGRSRMTFEDLDSLEARFLDIDANGQELILVLSNEHRQDLMAANRRLYREAMKDRKIGCFKLYSFSDLPYFDVQTGEKIAFGAAAGNDCQRASIAYMSSEVMRAEGDLTPFIREKDPKERGDIIGYQNRFIAMSTRNKYISAIYSDM